MATVVTRLKVESQEFDSKLKRATEQMQHMEREVRRTGATFAYADKEELKFVRSLGSMQTQATTAKGKLTELKNTFTELSVQYQRLTSQEKASPFGRAMSASIQQLQGRIKGLNAQLATTNRQMKGGIGGQFAQGLSSAFSSFGPAMMTATAVMGTINGLKKVIGDTVQTNMKFEQSTSVLASVMGKTRDEIGGLISQAKQLGATTQYTAIQITELQTNLARLGFSETEIMNSTRGVQALATATGADLGEAANLAGAALRAFGMDSSEMERVVSVLAVSTTKSALSFDKLATAVPIVAPVAKQFGFTIEDVVTLLGKLSDAGFDASMAATATRNIFLNMADGSGKLAQALGRPIRSIEDMAPAMAELRDRGIDLAEMLELTDKRSVAAFATFLDQADTMVKFKESITGCSDALQGMVDEQLNTLQGSVTIMKSAWEGLMLTFSESNGTIKRVVDSLTNLISKYTIWRNRMNGGDDAISTYELGVSDSTKQNLDAQIEDLQKRGASDESIIRGSEKKKAAYEKERDAMRSLLAEWEKAGRLGWGSQEVNDLLPQVEKVFGLSGGYAIDYAEQMHKMIARKNDQIAQHDYIIGALTPASVGQVAGGGEGGGALSAENILPQGSIAEIEARISELNKKLKMAADQTTRDAIRSNIALLKAELDMMNTELVRIEGNVVPIEVELAPTAEEVLKEGIDKMCKNIGIDPIELDVKIGKVDKASKAATDNAKSTADAWQNAVAAVNNVGSALQQIEDPAAKVSGIVMQAVANIALGFAQAAASPATGAAGVFGWIAAATAGVATMVATIASIKSVTKGYASGGMVEGTSYSGDNIVARLNAGEGVLTAQGVQNAAAMADGIAGSQHVFVEGRISGKDILLSANNTNRAAGGSRGYYTKVK